MTETKIPHFNYIGDSVIGSRCNFGAGPNWRTSGTITQTLRYAGPIPEKKKIRGRDRRYVQFGINCSINVGAMIGSNTPFSPGTGSLKVALERTHVSG